METHPGRFAIAYLRTLTEAKWPVGDPKLKLQYIGKQAEDSSPSAGWTYQGPTLETPEVNEDTSFTFGHNLTDSDSNPAEFNPFQPWNSERLP
jgi:hypothetical protein